MTDAWHVARTKPNAEFAAELRLKRQEFQVCLPRLLTVTTYRGVRSERQLPLFRGYLFVRFDPTDPGRVWASINNTRAVISLLPRADRPIPIPDYEIAKVQAYEKAGVFVRGQGKLFQPGQELRALRGVLADQVLTVLEEDDVGRIKVLWDCLGARRVVTLPLDHVTVR